MPTLLPVRPAPAVVPIHVPTVIASLLAVVVLTTMTALTPTKYPALSGVTTSAATRLH